jgi:hypothetical protein
LSVCLSESCLYALFCLCGWPCLDFLCPYVLHYLALFISLALRCLCAVPCFLCCALPCLTFLAFLDLPMCLTLPICLALPIFLAYVPCLYALPSLSFLCALFALTLCFSCLALPCPSPCLVKHSRCLPCLASALALPRIPLPRH